MHGKNVEMSLWKADWRLEGVELTPAKNFCHKSGRKALKVDIIKNEKIF